MTVVITAEIVSHIYANEVGMINVLIRSLNVEMAASMKLSAKPDYGSTTGKFHHFSVNSA